jgi:hypothetical protein
MVAFQGGHPPFKGDSPYLRPQPSWVESSPTRSKVLPLRRGGWVPHVMQAGPGRKKPNRHARCVQPPSGYEHSSAFAQTGGQAACNRAKWARPSDFQRTQRGGPRPRVMQPARRMLRASNCTATRTTATPPRLRNQYATRGDPAHDPAAPAWRDGQYGQKWAGSNGGGKRAGAAATSSAKLTSHPGAVREPSLTA